MKPTQTTVTRLQPIDADAWEVDRTPATNALARRDTYVPAARTATRMEILPPESHGAAPLVQPTATVESRVQGSYTDRAMGFLVATSALSVVVGVLSVIVAIAGVGVPFLSLGILGWFFAAFAAVWLAAWVVYNVASPDGNAVLHTWGLWGYMKREQKDRWAYYNRQLDHMEDRDR